MYGASAFYGYVFERLIDKLLNILLTYYKLMELESHDNRRVTLLVSKEARQPTYALPFLSLPFPTRPSANLLSGLSLLSPYFFFLSSLS